MNDWLLTLLICLSMVYTHVNGVRLYKMIIFLISTYSSLARTPKLNYPNPLIFNGNTWKKELFYQFSILQSYCPRKDCSKFVETRYQNCSININPFSGVTLQFLHETQAHSFNPTKILIDLSKFLESVIQKTIFSLKLSRLKLL